MPTAEKHQHSGDHHHGHSHEAGRMNELEEVSDARLLWAVLLNQLLTVGQVAAGIFSRSTALLSDAAHNFNDANALLIAYIARRISRKAANERYTFGYRRAEMIGALINLTLLAVIGLYLVYEGIMRFIEPTEVIGWVMAATAAAALVIDAATAVLLWAMSRGSMNVRAAFIHNIVDALSSLAVLIGAVAIMQLQWYWVDPAITLMIAAYVLWEVFRMLPKAIRILMEGTPPDLDLATLIERVEQTDGVEGIHHIHVWELDEQHRALEAHVVLQQTEAEALVRIKQEIRQLLHDDFEIQHSTLEFEFAGLEDHCDTPHVIPAH